ncbi:MAG: cytochrome c maturation protein CcmE [Myxococcota bacterium]
MNAGVKKILLGSVILVSAGYLLADSLFATDALTYFHPADEILADPDAFVDRRVRLGGHVLAGSIAQRPGTLDYYFEVKPIPGMTKNPEFLDHIIPVRFTGIVPDTFEDDAEVIVTGQLSADGTFHGQELVAKCPSKYEAAEKNDGTY